MSEKIVVRYSAVDGFRATRTFKTLAGARKYALERLGTDYELGAHYAVTFDGVGKVEVDGTTLWDLLAADPVVLAPQEGPEYDDAPDPDAAYERYLETRNDAYRAEVEEDLLRCGEPGL